MLKGQMAQLIYAAVWFALSAIPRSAVAGEPDAAIEQLRPKNVGKIELSLKPSLAAIRSDAPFSIELELNSTYPDLIEGDLCRRSRGAASAANRPARRPERPEVVSRVCPRTVGQAGTSHLRGQRCVSWATRTARSGDARSRRSAEGTKAVLDGCRGTWRCHHQSVHAALGSRYVPPNRCGACRSSHASSRP